MLKTNEQSLMSLTNLKAVEKIKQKMGFALSTGADNLKAGHGFTLDLKKTD